MAFSESSYPMEQRHLYPRPLFSLICVKTQICSHWFFEQGSEKNTTKMLNTSSWWVVDEGKKNSLQSYNGDNISFSTITKGKYTHSFHFIQPEIFPYRIQVIHVFLGQLTAIVLYVCYTYFSYLFGAEQTDERLLYFAVFYFSDPGISAVDLRLHIYQPSILPSLCHLPKRAGPQSGPNQWH